MGWSVGRERKSIGGLLLLRAEMYMYARGLGKLQDTSTTNFPHYKKKMFNLNSKNIIVSFKKKKDSRHVKNNTFSITGK